MIARIFTENKNYHDVVKLVRQSLPCATFIRAEGLWQGQTEKTLIIEIDCGTRPDEYRKRAEKIAWAVKKLNQQEKILVQWIECQSDLI